MPFSDNKPQIIRKSNELIEARYSLSLGEQRIILLLAGEISPDDEDFKDYEIRVADFARMFGLESSNSLYEKVQNAADSLVGKTLQLSTDVQISKKTVWLSYVEYITGSGIVKLRFDKALKPYLLQLKSHFTQYNSNYVINFKSQYSIRFYELLKMDAYKAKKGQFEKFFEVSDIRLLLGVDKNDYSLFADFKKRVIEPVIKEISNLTDLSIHDVKYGKTGRKITNVIFFVGVRSKDETHLRQANLLTEDIKPEKESDNHPIIVSLVNLGFSLEIAKKYKNKHGVKKIERNIAYTVAKNKERNISDVPSYLNKAIENDYGNAWEIKRKKEDEEKKQIVEAEKSKKDESDRKLKESKERHKKVLSYFYGLPQDVQDGIKKDFFESKQADEFVMKEWTKTERANQNPIERPSIKSRFVQFLIEQNLVV